MSIGSLCVHRGNIYCGLGNGTAIAINPANPAQQKVRTDSVFFPLTKSNCMLNNQIYRGMHHGFITSITAIGDNLFTASQDGTIQLWDLNTAEPKHTCKWHTKAVRVLHLSKDLGCLFSAGADQTLFRSVGIDLHPFGPSSRMYIFFRLPIANYLSQRYTIILCIYTHETQTSLMQSAANQRPCRPPYGHASIGGIQYDLVQNQFEHHRFVLWAL